MLNEEQLPPAEREFESALAGLRPADPSIDRDRLMFLAGCASVRRPSWMWPSVTVLLAVVLAVLLIARPAPQQIERIIYIESDRLPTAWMPTARTEHMVPPEAMYVKLRNRVLKYGLDALPKPKFSVLTDEPPLTIESLLNAGDRL